MVPLRKSKKGKRKTKNLLKIRKKSSPISPDPSQNSPDFDWWNTFWRRNSDSSVPTNEDAAFKHFFHISKKTFDHICNLVHQDLISRPPSGLINIEGRLLSVEKQAAIALRRLASGDSQVSVGAAFAVGQSTVSQVTWRFVESMELRARDCISWPGPVRFTEVKSALEARFGLQNCCGAVGAARVAMTLPAVESSDTWRDRDANYSMFLQGVVDHELRFLDVAVGWPGSMSPARVLRASGFFELCESGRRLGGSSNENSEEGREYVVGGPAYPILPWLMTPNGGGGTAAELAGRAFGVLKGTWRILDKVMWRPDKHRLPSIILVCCLLHNIMIDLGDEFEDGLEPEDDGREEREREEESGDGSGTAGAGAAPLKYLNSQGERRDETEKLEREQKYRGEEKLERELGNGSETKRRS